VPPNDERRALGPPPDENVVPTPPNTPDTEAHHKPQRHAHYIANGRLCGADTVTQLRRRRHASWRLPSLDCGCPDRWPCRCSEPPLSEKMIDAGRDAALHLLKCNTVPLLNFEVLQALWRRGGADRVLGELLHEACGGEIL
jgi:hypothetical protein